MHRRFNNTAGKLIGEYDRDYSRNNYDDAMPAKAVNEISDQQDIKWDPKVFVTRVRHEEIKKCITQRLIDEEECLLIEMKESGIQCLAFFSAITIIRSDVFSSNGFNR